MTNKIQTFLEEIYDNEQKPLFIARFGGMLKKRFENSFPNLSSEIANIPGFTVVSQEGCKERAAIARIGDVDETKELLSKPRNQLSAEDLNFLYALHKNVIYAFCSKDKTEGNFYIDTMYPYHYFSENQYAGLVEIHRKFLEKIYVPYNLRMMPAETASFLKKTISEWSNEVNVDLEIFTKKMNSKNDISLLEQVLAAIPTNRKSTISLPVDIIECLLKKKKI